MSVSEGQPPAPVRPIPIHLPRAPELGGLRFTIPLSFEKQRKYFPRLWNPALDLYNSCSDIATNLSTHVPLKTNVRMQVSLPSNLPVSSTSLSTLSGRSSETTTPLMKSLKRSPTSPVTNVKTPSGTYTSIYEQLERHLPLNHENSLAVLASKARLFPILLGVPGSLFSYATQTANAAHSHHPPSHGQIRLQSAQNLSQSRHVIERITSSQPQIIRGSLDQQQQLHTHHHQHQHDQQQHDQQQHNLNLQHSPVTQLHHTMSSSDRPLTLQNPLAFAHSHAFLGRINTSQMLSPGIALDNTGTHSLGRKLFPCPQCRYTTDRRNNLKRHMLTMHQTSSKMLECCGILFSTKASLREHAMIFHYQGYTCYFCGRRFCRKALLKRHLSVHNGQKDFVCSVCDYATSHKSNLERHRKVHSRQDDGKDGEGGRRYHDDDTQRCHDDGKSNSSEAVSHEDISSDDLSVCSDYDDDTDVEINVHSD